MLKRVRHPSRTTPTTSLEGEGDEKWHEWVFVTSSFRKNAHNRNLEEKHGNVSQLDFQSLKTASGSRAAAFSTDFINIELTTAFWQSSPHPVKLCIRSAAPR